MFDVSNLPFRNQFEVAVAVSGVCLVAAIVLREWFADREIRIIARVLGLAGWAVVVTFAWRMTETNETLATQLMVKSSQRADNIGEVSATTVSVQTKSGYRVTIGEVKNAGRTGAMCFAAGRRGCKDSYSTAEAGRCRHCNNGICDCGYGPDGNADSTAKLHCGKQPESAAAYAYDNGESF